MRIVNCPYCCGQAEYVDSSVIYGRSYGMMYLCRDCDAYVGVHKGTDKPLGRLANAELRQWKIKAHSAFDTLWQNSSSPLYKKRNKAYEWLAKQLNLPVEKTHIGMFDVEECKKVIFVCNIKTQGFSNN